MGDPRQKPYGIDRSRRQVVLQEAKCVHLQQNLNAPQDPPGVECAVLWLTDISTWGTEKRGVLTCEF